MAKNPLRVFDVDFAEIAQTLNRDGAAPQVSTATYGDICEQQMVFEDEVGGALFYEAIDLSQLTLEGRTFQPLQVIVNRPYTVPRGTKWNPNPCVQNEEYFFIWYSNVAYPSNPSGKTSAQKQAFIQALRACGMNTSPLTHLTTAYEEEQPNLGQLLWASSAAFLPSLDTSLSVPNGFVDNDPVTTPNKLILLTNSMRKVDSSEWGCMEPVQGPMLHFFRLVTDYSNNMGGVPIASDIVENAGYSTSKWSPVNIKVVCEEVDLSDTEYLTTAYNTLMRQTPGGPN